MMFEQASAVDAAPPNRGEVFARFLTKKLHELLGNEPPPTTPLPLVISGMASSSVGWRELPYARTPFAIDGGDLVSQPLDWNSPPWLGPTHLISGVATQDDMMRGEECEIIGLMSSAELAPYRERCLLILPGTHSKHVRIENSRIVEWRTFMTGELFEVLGRHSLLRASLDLAARHAEASRFEASDSAFAEGVRTARERGLAATLFKVRTRAVLHGVSAHENTAFFSGLLIGAEILEMARSGDGAAILAGNGATAQSYRRAMDLVFPSTAEWIQLPPEEVERATVVAHALFLERESGR